MTAQCLATLKPLILSSEDANHVRSLIGAETKKEGSSADLGAEHVSEKLAELQRKLNRLTRAYLDEKIEEEIYQALTAELIVEKTTLKQEKQRFQKTGSIFWNEAAKEVINTLEMAGKMQTEQSPQEISQMVHKVGTNRLLSRKTVTFSLSKPYDLIPSLLASSHLSTSSTASSLGDETGGSTKWCA